MTEQIGLVAVLDVDQFNRGLDQYLSGMNRIEDSTDKTVDALDDLVYESKRGNEALFGIEKALDDLVSEMLSTSRATDEVSDGIDDIGDEAKESEKQVGKFGDTLKIAIGTTIGNLASSAAMAVVAAVREMGTALIGLGKESTTLAIDFQSSMTELSIAVGSTGPSIQELKQAALAVGGASNLVGVSASGAAEAMTGLYKAGLTTTEIFGDFNATLKDGSTLSGALRAAIDLAAASELDMVQASELAAISLATFGSELETEEERAEFVREALDNFSKSANASVADVSQLSDAMGNFGTTAASFGFSLQDTNNALAILSGGGIKGAEAGTALKSMFTNLMRTTDDVTGTLDSLGVSLFNVSDGTMKEMPIILEDLANALYGTQEVMVEVGGRTEEQNKLLDMAQTRYQQLTTRIQKHNAGLVVMSDSALKKANDEMVQSQAIIQELSGIHGTAVSTTRQLTEEQRLQAIQTLAGTYGMKAMSTLLEEVIDVNEDGISGWEAMAQATEAAAGVSVQAGAKAQTLAGQMEALDGVIETLKIQFGDALLPAITEIVQAFTGLAEKHGPSLVASLGKIVPALEFVIESLTGTIDEGMTWRDFIQNDFEPAIELGISIVKSFGEAIDKFARAVTPVFEAIKETVVDEILPDLQIAIERLGEVFSGLGITWEDVALVIQAVVTVAAGVIIGAIGIIIAAIDGIITVITTLAEYVPGVIDGLQMAWQGFVDFLDGIIGFFVKLLNNDAEGAIESLVKGVKGGLDTLAGLFLAAANIVAGVLEAIIKGIKEFVGTIIEFFENLAQELVGGSIIPDMIDAIIGWFQTLYDNAAMLIGNLVSFISSAWTAIKEAIPAAWSVITSAIETAIAAIPSAVSSAVDSVIQIGKDMVSRIASGITETWNTVVGVAIQGAIETTKLAQSAIDALKSFGGSIVGKIKSGIDNAWGNITGAINGLIEGGFSLSVEAISAIASIGTSIISIIRTAITSSGGIASALREVVVDGVNSVIDRINSMIDSINELLNTSLPKLPRLESGILNFSGGSAIVGESGPEIVTLPTGSNVFPTNSPVSNITNSTTSITQIFNLNLSGSGGGSDLSSDAGLAMREVQVSAALRR